MSHSSVVAFCGAVLLCASSAAAATTFGSRGTITLSAERLFGVHAMHTSIENDQPRSRDVLVAGLGWYRSETAYHNPRLALDVFVIDKLSVGGSLGVYFWGSDGERGGFLFAPRVGYALTLSERVVFWPRGGLTYFSEDETGGRPTYSQFAFSAEGTFAFLLSPGWAVLAGPTIDFGLAGQVDDRDFHQRAMGITAGLMGVF